LITIEIGQETKDKLESLYNSLGNIEDVPIHMKGLAEKVNFAVSDKYLDIMKTENTGPPHMLRGYDLLSWENPTPEWDKIIEQAKNIIDADCAIFAYYPEDGFIGWHDNSDAPGYTILFSHSEDGDGFYRYIDARSKLKHTIDDKPGWTCKTGYYGKYPMNTFHCAKTSKPRWSIAFIIKKQHAWSKCINSIVN